mmetsp:Transcript_57545/g.186831  ORF Transcript_57545/g.186831 Transcript_57545/m.186831 type:complete len:201 (+) Transcript_57545:2236-2838(+)
MQVCANLANRATNRPPAQASAPSPPSCPRSTTSRRAPGRTADADAPAAGAPREPRARADSGTSREESRRAPARTSTTSSRAPRRVLTPPVLGAATPRRLPLELGADACKGHPPCRPPAKHAAQELPSTFPAAADATARHCASGFSLHEALANVSPQLMHPRSASAWFSIRSPASPEPTLTSRSGPSKQRRTCHAQGQYLL